jgi:TPR repeat protein
MFAMNNLSFAQEVTKKNQQTKEQKELEDANKKKIKDSYTEAQKAAKTNKGEAISLYNEILSIDPDFSDAYLKLADIYAEENDYNSALSAIGFYKKYLELKPKDPNVKTLKVKISLLEEKLKSMEERSQADKNITLNDVSVEETNAFDEIEFTDDYLKGRWVSDVFSSANGRETWILDIDIVRNTMRITIAPYSFITASSLLYYYSPNRQNGNYLDALVTSTAEGIISEDANDLNFKYEIDHHYLPVKTAGTTGKGLNRKVGDVIDRLLKSKNPLSGLLGDVQDVFADAKQEEILANDIQVDTYAYYDFKLKPTASGLKGTVWIFRQQKSERGTKYLINTVEECNLYKVNSNYTGFTFARAKDNDKDRIKEKTDNYNRLTAIFKEKSKTDNNALNDLGYLYLNCSNWIDGNADNYWKLALKCFENSAKENNTAAMQNMALMYRYGFGMKEKDIIKSIEWYKKAIDSGDTDAMVSLAYMYLLGENINYAEAKELYMQAANKGNIDAIYGMGWMYSEGMGVDSDYKIALEYYLAAVNKGHTGAMNAIGNIYKNGLGVNRNYTEAFNWYMKSAEHGNADAMKEISNMYLSGLGVTKDFYKAMDWRRKFLEARIDRRIGMSIDKIPYSF